MTYGTGNVQGDIIQDDISVAGLALPAHTFGVATAESVDFSDDSVPFDGLMGLAQSVRVLPTSSLSIASAIMRVNQPLIASHTDALGTGCPHTR